MPYLVLMCFSTANDNTGDSDIIMERIFDFNTEENYNEHDDNMFDCTLEHINDNLPKGCYIDDGFPEPVRFLGTEYTDEIDKSQVINIPVEL